MGYIVNDYVENNRLYIGDREMDENTVSSLSYDLKVNETGGMRSDISDNIEQLSVAAKNVVKKRKPIYDWKTNNKSFTDLYQTYCKLGIKNNKFFLKLYDRDLQGVKVYEDVLNLEMQLKIFLECLINPYYWLREVCRIPQDGKPIIPGGGSEFIADRNNIASWYCYLNGIDHYDSKSRQLGKTQNAVAQINYAFHYGSMSSTTLFFSKDFPLAKQNLYRLKCQRDMLPKWMQMRISYKEGGGVDKGQDSITQMRNPITNNIIKVMPKATSLDNAIKMGRGETASQYWDDEYDFTPFNNDIMDAAAPAYNTARTNAKTNKTLYGRILTSTPGYLNTKEGKAADKRISKMLKWDDSMLDEPINKIHSLLNSKKCNGFMYIEHSWKQLGKSMKWYADLCKLLDYDSDKILREIELQRIQGNEKSPFKKQNLVYISQNTKEPIEKLDLRKDLQPILIYEKLNKKISYILSVDPAEGLSLNNTAFTLINPHTEMIVAEYKSPYISPPDFFRMLCKFIKLYVPRSMIVVEANRGRELINRFLESPYRLQLWYNPDKLVDKVVRSVDKYGSEKQASYERRAFGFDTTTKSKPLLFSIIERFMEDELDKVNTKYLVKDVSAVQRKPNGTIILGADDDDEGEGHGDVLMAYLIGLFVLFNAKNLEEFGVSPGSAEPILDPEDILKRSIPETKEKIKDLIGTLPEHMQGIFMDYLKQTDPVEESRKFHRELQREYNKQEHMMQGSDDFFVPDRNPYIDPMEQDQLWRSTEQTIMERYGRERDDSNREFQVEDWI